MARMFPVVGATMVFGARVRPPDEFTSRSEVLLAATIAGNRPETSSSEAPTALAAISAAPTAWVAISAAPTAPTWISSARTALRAISAGPTASVAGGGADRAGREVEDAAHGQGALYGEVRIARGPVSVTGLSRGGGEAGHQGHGRGRADSSRGEGGKKSSRGLKGPWQRSRRRPGEAAKKLEPPFCRGFAGGFGGRSEAPFRR